jgi:tRNA pseudouridine55 synthase
VRLSIVCGKGTYVRALAADLGAALGCGATVERLVRTRVGPFTLDDATPWEMLASAPAPVLWARVQPAAATLAGWTRSVWTRARPTASSNGQPVDVAPGRRRRHLVRVHAPTAGCSASVRSRSVDGRPTVRILHADRPGPRVRPA